jgi:hypothetical protein
MGQRGDSDCKFRLDSLVSIEKDTDDTYIGSQTINKFNIATNLIQNDTNNVYKFIKPTISSVEFKNNDLIFNRNYRVDEITNNQLFNQYLMLKTNFGEAAD